MSSWRVSAVLVGLFAAMFATFSVGLFGLSGHGWWSMLAFVAIALSAIGALTLALVPSRSRRRHS